MNLTYCPNFGGNYNTPKLISQKENLIKELSVEKKESRIWFLILSVILIIISLLLVFNYVKRKRYKIRFEELMKENMNTKKHRNLKHKNIDEKLGISEDLVDKILLGLDKFEQSNDFTRLNITSNQLAKQLKTNSKYLTKIIKHHKHKNFSPYLNDLRINYIINRLKKDKKLQDYTIKAVAKEAGFNSAEVFSKYFFKKTGIYPSYFIKSIQSAEKQ